MSTLLRPNRPVVDKTFPVLGFTVRTGRSPSWFEVAIATEPELLRLTGKDRRTVSNFYSTRALGPLPAERGEAIFLVPPAVLARFVGQPRVYYGLATFERPDRQGVEISLPPADAAPSVLISQSFGGTTRRLPGGPAGRTPRGDGYGSTPPEPLVWAGDDAAPGTVERAAPGVAAPGIAPAAGPSVAPTPTVAPANGAPAPTNGAAHASALEDFVYDDGLGLDFWAMEANEVAPDGSADSAEPGIDGPIPDEPPSAAAESLAVAQPFDAPEYPQASRFEPANPANYRSASGRTIDKIVIHITDGGARIGGPISWFKNRRAGVSAHYIVGQNGEVVQMVKHADVAWHAHAANGTAIGIEHVANTRGLAPTEAEYCASAALVNWLCTQYGIPMDRTHIQGHAEADTRTTHRACPNAVWDWDYFMGMVTSAQCYPKASAPTSQSLDVSVFYPVQLVPQPDKLSCLVASVAMLVGYKRSQSVTPERMAEEIGLPLRTSHPTGRFLRFKEHFDMRAIDLPSNATLYPSPQQWYEWLTAYGPLLVTVDGNPSHAFVVRGLRGVLTPGGTFICVSNPWDRRTTFDGDSVDFHPTNVGREYEQSFADFAADFGNLGLSDYGQWRVLYLASGSAQSQSLGEDDGDTAPAEPGIDGPIPDEPPSAAESLAVAQPFVAPEYPQASRFEPANAANYRSASGRTIDKVVIHITDGGSSIAGPISWFKNPAARVSAHYIVGQNGEVVQMVHHANVAWHASSANGTSIGIEHVANTRGLAPTEAEYCASASLVNWLCTQYGIPMDRTHIQGHAEADTHTTHTACPNAVWDWDYFMGMVTSGQCYPKANAPASQSLGYGTAFALTPMGGDDVERMRVQFVANASAGSPQNCITISNSGLRQLYGSKLQDSSGQPKTLGTSIQDTMAALQGYSLAGTAQVFEFLNAGGSVTKGTTRPERLASSVEGWVKSEAEANAMSGWYVFGLSIMDGYHSVVIAMSFSGTNDPSTHVYWADQIYTGWDDVSNGLDARITQLTQRWWDPLPANRKAKTRATVWPLNP